MKNLSKYPNTAIVLGMTLSGLSAVRSLGRSGIKIIAMDYDPSWPGLGSKYCQSKICPHPILEPKALRAFLLREGKKIKEKGVLFPTADEFVSFVSSNRKALQRYFLFALPDRNIMESLLNKRHQYTMARKSGIPCPQTFYPKNMEEAEAIKKEIRYPAVIKPCLTYEWKQIGFTTKGLKVSNEREFIREVKAPLQYNLEIIVQSVIPGPPSLLYEVMAYFDRGHNPLALFIKRKLRQFPLDFGVGSFEESTWDQALAERALEFLRTIEYWGMAEIEFKKDPRDNIYKFIEINPRLILQTSLADYCGINLPLIQYLDSIGKSLPYINNYKTGVKWIWLTKDFQSFYELYRKKQISLPHWIKSICRCKDFATFSWDDPKPFLRELRYGILLLKLPSYLIRSRRIASAARRDKK